MITGEQQSGQSCDRAQSPRIHHHNNNQVVSHTDGQSVVLGQWSVVVVSVVISQRSGRRRHDKQIYMFMWRSDG